MEEEEDEQEENSGGIAAAYNPMEEMVGAMSVIEEPAPLVIEGETTVEIEVGTTTEASITKDGALDAVVEEG